MTIATCPNCGDSFLKDRHPNEMSNLVTQSLLAQREART